MSERERAVYSCNFGALESGARFGLDCEVKGWLAWKLVQNVCYLTQSGRCSRRIDVESVEMSLWGRSRAFGSAGLINSALSAESDDCRVLIHVEAIARGLKSTVTAA